MAHEKETLEAVIQARNQAQSSLQAASQNPGDASAIAGLAEQKVCWVEHLGVYLPFPKVIPTLKPTKTWPTYRKN